MTDEGQSLPPLPPIKQRVLTYQVGDQIRSRLAPQERKQPGQELEPEYVRKILLGKDNSTNKDVTLYPEEFALGGYFLGVRRVGKSTLLENLIMQDIRQRKVGVFVIDPHGDLIKNVLFRIDRKTLENGEVILIDPKDYEFPFGLNIYECTDKDSPIAVEYTVNRVMSLFEKMWPSKDPQPLVEDVMRATAYTIIANGLTMPEIHISYITQSFATMGRQG